MPVLELKEISNYVCRDLQLKVNHGEILALLGPNGAGKTTILNIIAGFVDYRGTVLIDGFPVDDQPCRERNVGYVFQDLALFPHLDCFSNVAFGLRTRAAPDKIVYDRVMELLKLVGVPHLAGAYPKTMSGGEKQRVALARALAVEPSILLLDEPFAKLDPPTVKPLEDEIFKIIRSLELTTVMVTHNVDIAFSAGDRIAILNEGRVLQIGLPGEIFRKPGTRFVAEFMDVCNIYSGTARMGSNGLEIDVKGLTIHAAEGRTGRISISIRPDDILISTKPVESSARNSFIGKIKSMKEYRHLCHVEIDTGVPMRAVITRQSWEHMHLSAGSEVYVFFKASSVHVFK